MNEEDRRKKKKRQEYRTQIAEQATLEEKIEYVDKVLLIEYPEDPEFWFYSGDFLCQLAFPDGKTLDPYRVDALEEGKLHLARTEGKGDASIEKTAIEYIAAVDRILAEMEEVEEKDPAKNDPEDENKSAACLRFLINDHYHKKEYDKASEYALTYFKQTRRFQDVQYAVARAKPKLLKIEKIGFVRNLQGYDVNDFILSDTPDDYPANRIIALTMIQHEYVWRMASETMRQTYSQVEVLLAQEKDPNVKRQLISDKEKFKQECISLYKIMAQRVPKDRGKWCGKVLEVDPSDVGANLWMGRKCLEEEKWEEGLKYYAKGFEHWKKSDEYFDWSKWPDDKKKLFNDLTFAEYRFCYYKEMKGDNSKFLGQKGISNMEGYHVNSIVWKLFQMIKEKPTLADPQSRIAFFDVGFDPLAIRTKNVLYQKIKKEIESYIGGAA